MLSDLSTIRIPLSVAACLLGLGLAPAALAAGETEPARITGHDLAKEACSACHQVEPGQMRPPLVANPDEGSKIRAPSFIEIAKLCLAEGDLRAKITNPHYPMREQLLTPVDVDGLSRYIRSLAPGANCPLPVR
jgi:mono/diheme cytochrome c family protein